MKKIDLSRHVAKGPLVRTQMVQHLSLSFSDENWSELLEIIDAKVRSDLAAKPISRRRARAESCAVKAAALKLLNSLDDDTEHAIEWRIYLGVYSEFRDNWKGTDWLPEMRRRLGHIVEAVDQLKFDGVAHNAKDGRRADHHRRMFASTMADHFIRAGGSFSRGGRAGFPAFLKLVWELLPNGHRPNTAEGFADMIGREINKSDQRVQSQARADYGIRLTRGYWGLPCK